ncbi:MAG: hypothetical protein V2I97_22225 [Desulfococcaceae bacterium]|jgi:hypothetical protein|nr:hypothetical protein [Desulfococcaceae bacterium]
MKKNIPIFLFIFLLFCGCAVHLPPVYEKEGKEYGHTEGIFRERWYDYYRVALSYMEGDFRADALVMLDLALVQRDTDRRMAKTFGMHFIDYFPHREKGILLYLNGRDEAAKKELELSLSQYPSAKAFFYLDKIRIRMMEKEKLRISAPSIDINLPGSIRDESASFLTGEESPVLSAVIRDSQYVSEIFLNDRPVWLEFSEQSLSFQESLDLGEGQQDFRITARNLMGGKTEQRFTVHADRSGPIISISEYIPGIRISGRIYDLSGYISLEVNGKDIPLEKGQDVSFSLPSAGQMILTAKDRLGNRTDLQMGNTASAGFGLLAENRYAMKGSDRETALSAAAKRELSVIADGWQGEDRAFRENIRMSIRVEGPEPIREIRINDRILPGLKGRMISHNIFIPLQIGENSVRISVRDEKDRETQKEIRITRKIPDAFGLHRRYCLMMHRFESEKAGNIEFFFAGEILKQKRFQLLINPEMEMTDIFNALTIPPVKSHPHALLLGLMYENRRGTEIAVRVTDAQSSEIIAIADAWSEQGNQKSFEIMARNLSESLHRKLPLADGKIRDIQGQKFRLKAEKWIPQRGNLKKGWPLMIYREISPDDRLRGSDTVPAGSGEAENPQNDGSYSGVLNGELSGTGTDYRVISR